MTDTDEQKAMLQRLRFSEEAAMAIIDQGYTQLEELKELEDDDVENLCKIIRKPGGESTIGKGDKATTKSDPGIKVSLVAELYLKLACYFIMHQLDRVSRTPTRADMTTTNVKTIKELRKREKDYKFPDKDEYPIIDTKSWPDTFDGLNQFLRTNLGNTGIPLFYIVRIETEVQLADKDPSTNYENGWEEMISRAPHSFKDAGGKTRPTPAFITDNHAVWNIIEHMCKGTTSATVVKPYQKKRDGRNAYLALYQAHLGPNAVNDLVTQTEAQLDGFKYRGESKKANFEKFVSYQRKRHCLLADLVPFGYRGMDERSKVRILNKNIETERLDTIKAQILGDQTLQESYDKSVGLYKSFISQMKSTQEKQVFQVASATTDKVEDRYYTKEEYKRLSEKAKRKLWELREARGGPKRKKLKTGETGKKDIVSKRDFNKLTSQVASLTAAIKAKDTDEAAETDEEQTKESSNRTNKALTKNKVKK